jgi:hypothetical protein
MLADALIEERLLRHEMEAEPVVDHGGPRVFIGEFNDDPREVNCQGSRAPLQDSQGIDENCS